MRLLADLEAAAQWDRTYQVKQLARRLKTYPLDGLAEREDIKRWLAFAPGRGKGGGGSKPGAGRPRRERPAEPAVAQWERCITALDGEGWGTEPLDSEQLEAAYAAAAEAPMVWPELRRAILAGGGMRPGDQSRERIRALAVLRVHGDAPDEWALRLPAECAAARGLYDPDEGEEALLAALEACQAAWRKRSLSSISTEGRQVYRLMTAFSLYGDGTWKTHQLWRGGLRLTTREILHWVVRLPGHLVGFSLGYDWAMWLLDLEPRQLRALKNGATVSHGPFTITMTAGKLLVVTKVRTAAGRRGSIRREIWDAFPWYQKSFVRALDETRAVARRDVDLILEGKARRGDSEHAVDDELQYAWTECHALARMQRSLYALCREAGFDLYRFYGPGSLAELMLDRAGATEHHGEIPAEVAAVLPYGYFGGRFEDRILGELPAARSYDLASAYVWALANLPSFKGVRWERVTSWAPGDVGLYRVRFSGRGRSGAPAARMPDHWGPLPCRSRQQEVFWPRCGETWAWHPELEVMSRENGWPFSVLEGWRAVLPHREVRPFAFLTEVYARRRRLKDEGNPLELVFKLGPNSMYGKLAQMIGGGGRHTFIPWASLITAMTRARLLDVIRAHPWSVVSCATDGILTAGELPLEAFGGGLGGLGDWEDKGPREDGFLAGLGLQHWAQSKTRSRGFRGGGPTQAAEIPDQAEPGTWSWESIRAYWRWWLARNQKARGETEFPPSVPVRVQRFVGILLGLAWNRPELIGCWIQRTQAVRFGSPKTDRIWRNRRGWVVRPGSSQWTVYVLPRHQAAGHHPYPYDGFSQEEWEMQRAEAADNGLANG